jgi:hypothetical protein
LHGLLEDESQEVMISLLGNIDKIIERYANYEAVKSFNSADHIRVEHPEVPASNFLKGKEPAISVELIGGQKQSQLSVVNKSKIKRATTTINDTGLSDDWNSS